MRCAILALLVLFPPRALSSDDSVEQDDRLQSFLDWFRQEGGTVDERLTVSAEPGLDIRGTVALEDIPAETVVLHCPKDLMIHGGGDGDGDGVCGDVATVAAELRLGKSSKWWPYLDMDDSLNSRIPMLWERNGRASQALQGLPPADRTHRHLNWWVVACNGGRDPDPIQLRALLMFITRASDLGLIPIYDLLNHDNGLINTYGVKDERGGLSIKSRIPISKGEPIYNTYARGGSESAPDIFNDYGFLESWPQLWRWEADDDDMGRERLVWEFVAFPDQGWVALSPTLDWMSDFGNRKVDLDEWERRIARHNANISGHGAKAFQRAAASLLESLPTTLQEDKEILVEEREKLTQYKEEEEERNNQLDVVRAIEYRMAFKRALTLAVHVASNSALFGSHEEL